MGFDQKGITVISITIDANDAADAKEQMRQLIAPQDMNAALKLALATMQEAGFAPPPTVDEMPSWSLKPVDPAAMTEVGEKIAQTQASASTVDRVRGQPSPGKARRTKAEIAEDDAAAATGAALMGSTPANTFGTDSEPVAEDSPEVQAADAADEAAETAAAKVDGKLTLDDVRNALGLYVGAFGMAAAQADGPVLIAKVLGVEHNPAAPKKISDLGDDQVLLRRAVDGVSEMITKNPFSRTKAA